MFSLYGSAKTVLSGVFFSSEYNFYWLISLFAEVMKDFISSIESTR